jgi:ubiquitin-protein ligase E3 C
VATQLRAFALGARHVLPEPLLCTLRLVYSMEEVSELISGTGAVRKADVAAWKQHTQYEGITVMGGSLLGRTHRLAQDFWKVVENHMTDADRGRLLQFVTGSPRIPMGGFDKLPEKFTIETSWYLRTEDLPRASVCSATLTLPPYKNLPTLKKNLLLAIRHMEFEE